MKSNDPTNVVWPGRAYLNDRHLAEKDRQNCWGYNKLGFCALEMRYSASRKVKEFQTMVKTLHAAGIEVILDVVYNHTCEGNQMGPALSMRGVDNAAHHTINADKRRDHDDFTGCGNTVNLQHPRALQLVIDSLHYWVEEMHVDGFRFDLASALPREAGKVKNLGGFFDAIRQDPVPNRVKLIAEPWDLGNGGYQVGKFPLGWAEWDDRYRDGMRGDRQVDSGVIGEVAQRLTGSQNLYGRSGKRPHASINFITAHNSFALHHLVPCNKKPSEGNNVSWHFDVVGLTEDSEVNALRERQKCNLLGTLLLLLSLRRSWVVPHLAGQTEGGHFWREGEALRVKWPLGGANAPTLHLPAHFGPMPLRDVVLPPGKLVYACGIEPDGDALRLAKGVVRVTLQEHSNV